MPAEPGGSFNGQPLFRRAVGLLVDYEWTHRQNRRQARLLKAASLKIKACMEDVDYSHPRGLDRGLMENLASGQWLLCHQNVLISGPAGVGKTYLLCALTNQASGRVSAPNTTVYQNCSPI